MCLFCSGKFSRRKLFTGSLGLIALNSLPKINSQELPNLGDDLDLSIYQEKIFGDQLARNLYRQNSFLEEPTLDFYISTIWNKLITTASNTRIISQSMKENYAWKITLQKIPQMNAFAMPGGYFGLNLGMIAQTENRHELASVLAHELSHVTQRHIARSISDGKKQAPLVIGGVLLSALASLYSADAGIAALTTTQGASIQQQLSFSRDMEREADRMGFNLMKAAGFLPQGAMEMFEKMQEINRFNDNGNFPYLRTHPLTKERIADMQARSLNLKKEKNIVDEEQILMSARAKIIAQQNINNLRQWSLNKKNTLESLYLKVLSLIQLRDFKNALNFWQKLNSLKNFNSENIYIKLLKAEILIKSKEFQKAENFLQNEDLNLRPIFLFFCQSLLEQNKSVTRYLRTWINKNLDDALAWQLLSQSYNLENKQLSYLRSEAEIKIAYLDYQAGIEKLKVALKFSKENNSKNRADIIETEIISSRLKQIEELLKIQKQNII